MTYDTVVVGAGLAGLTAALRLAEQGQRVLVVAKGVGATHLAPPAIDVLGYLGEERVSSPAASLPALVASQPDHPYARVSTQLVADSLAWLSERAPELGFAGGLDENLLLPTAAGVPKPSALVTAPAFLTMKLTRVTPKASAEPMAPTPVMLWLAMPATGRSSIWKPSPWKTSWSKVCGESWKASS